jgi:DNA-binding protein YbaB
MTGHRPTPDELTELAGQLSTEAQHLYSAAKRRQEAMRAAETEALKATAEAGSRDGTVRVRVDAGGMLLDLALTADALRAGPDELATKILDLAQHAAADARATVREVYEPLRREGITKGMPVLLPSEPVAAASSPAKPERRAAAEEEASYDERTITRRARRR